MHVHAHRHPKNDLLEMKTKIHEIKIYCIGINSRLAIAEGKISEFKDGNKTIQKWNTEKIFFFN